jgi:hypothetical protein
METPNKNGCFDWTDKIVGRNKGIDRNVGGSPVEAKESRPPLGMNGIGNGHTGRRRVFYRERGW